MVDYSTQLKNKGVIAISKSTSYNYELLQTEPVVPAPIIRITEYIDIKKLFMPSYDIYINECKIKVAQERWEVPSRFLEIIEIMNKYIDNYTYGN